MTRLDYSVWNVNQDNDALFTWAIGDLSKLAQNTAEQIANTFASSGSVAVENTVQLVRKPLATIFSWSNWAKLARTPFVAGSDIAMKAARLPFSRLDDAVTYVVNNNFERLVTTIKSYTSGLVSNIITNNGQSRFKTLRGIWTAVEWIGDAIWSIIKLPWGIISSATSTIDGFLAKGTSATQKWVDNLRISDTNFIPKSPESLGIINSASHPEAANDNSKTTVEQAA